GAGGLGLATAGYASGLDSRGLRPTDVSKKPTQQPAAAGNAPAPKSAPVQVTPPRSVDAQGTIGGGLSSPTPGQATAPWVQGATGSSVGAGGSAEGPPPALLQRILQHLRQNAPLYGAGALGVG